LLKVDRQHNIPRCFTCGREFTLKPSTGDDNTHRFCHPRCREAFDNGAPPFDPNYASKNNPRWYSLPIGPQGFYINCAGCGCRFDSKGLRCCSPECERRYRDRQESIRLKPP